MDEIKNFIEYFNKCWIENYRKNPNVGCPQSKNVLLDGISEMVDMAYEEYCNINQNQDAFSNEEDEENEYDGSWL